jgi:hypothetical protein
VNVAASAGAAAAATPAAAMSVPTSFLLNILVPSWGGERVSR